MASDSEFRAKIDRHHRKLVFLRAVSLTAIVLAATTFVCDAAVAHGVAASDKGFLELATGAQILPFIYLGA
ncbi:MAG TPA: hypothetical protein VET48_05315, partial [Steroidobacteraceae bacterium]|nr:hypothetical protein [Steroidobacteraceae bacterium]